jgi:YgiT-type zinc finger domain-containing protein
METKVKITHCPHCGSDQICLLKQDWTGTFEGQVYIVPDLEFYQCPQCGERIYDREAMRKIEAYSPAFQRKIMEPAELTPA